MEAISNLKDLQTLFRALKQNDLGCVTSLVNRLDPGIDLGELQDESSNKTPLMHAIENDQKEIFDAILKVTKNLNAKNIYGNTALHLAAHNGGFYFVKSLIERGAKLNLQNKGGETSLLIAVKQRYPSLQIVSLFTSHPGNSIDMKDSLGRTALHYASHKAIGTELLLKAGAAPSVSDHSLNTPLHLASIEGFDHTVQCLIKHGADVNLRNEFGRTPLHYLAMKGHCEAVKELIDAGADLNIWDKELKSALWYAVANQRESVARLLLLSNCLPDNVPDNSGPCLPQPIALAFTSGRFELFYLLLLCGSSISNLNNIPMQDTELEERLKRNPASLKHSSRCVIRSTIRANTQCIRANNQRIHADTQRTRTNTQSIQSNTQNLRSNAEESTAAPISGEYAECTNTGCVCADKLSACTNSGCVCTDKLSACTNTGCVCTNKLSACTNTGCVCADKLSVGVNTGCVCANNPGVRINTGCVCARKLSVDTLYTLLPPRLVDYLMLEGIEALDCAELRQCIVGEFS